MTKVPDTFSPEMVMNQLRYSGMMETVRIRRSGYPVRRVFADFLFRYGMLGRNLGLPEGKEKCGAIMKLHDPEGKDWQNGKTKVGRVDWTGEESKGRHCCVGLHDKFTPY